jgi:hypothetical protein
MGETDIVEILVRSTSATEIRDILELFAEAGQSVAISDDLGRFWGGPIDAETVLAMKPWVKEGAYYRIRYSRSRLEWISSLSPGVRQLEKEAARAERGMRQTTAWLHLALTKLKPRKARR